ncbi:MULTISPECIES: NTP transferase domain-containing protein [Acidiplasma]|nr:MULTISPECIES: NTP transferase domain-containing protein [Acidiplasma]
MEALIMAGGMGKRIGNPKKMLLMINGEAIIIRLLKIIKSLGLNINVCTGPETVFLNEIGDVNIINGTGDYAMDLKTSINSLKLPVIVLPADILIDKELLKSFIEKSKNYKTGILNMLINNELSGISIFYEYLNDAELAYENINFNSNSFFNINTEYDYKMAKEYYKNMH